MVGVMSAEPSPETPAAAPAGSLRARMADWRAWAPRAVFESLLIVFSVVLALGVTNWAEDRRTAHRVSEMRAFLIEEIRLNRTTLRDPYWLPHHERLNRIVGSAAMMESPGRANAEAAMAAVFETGIHVGGPRDTVWRGFEASGLMSEMDPQEIFLLSDIYRTQELLSGADAGINGSLGDILQGFEDGSGIRAGLMRVHLYLSDVVAAERDLIVKYDAALARLDPDGDIRPAPAAATRTDDAGPAKR